MVSQLKSETARINGTRSRGPTTEGKEKSSRNAIKHGGIQIADPAGRTVGILRKPDNSDPSNVVFGGPDLQTLYVTSGDKVFRRPIKKKGTFPWAPVMPPKPSL